MVVSSPCSPSGVATVVFFGRLVVSVCSCAAVGVGVNRRCRDRGGCRVDTFAAGVRLAEVGEEEQWVVVCFSVVVMRGQFAPGIRRISCHDTVPV